MLIWSSGRGQNSSPKTFKLAIFVKLSVLWSLLHASFGNCGIHKMVSSRRKLGPIQNIKMNLCELSIFDEGVVKRKKWFTSKLWKWVRKCGLERIHQSNGILRDKIRQETSFPRKSPGHVELFVIFCLNFRSNRSELGKSVCNAEKYSNCFIREMSDFEWQFWHELSCNYPSHICNLTFGDRETSTLDRIDIKMGLRKDP